MERPLARLPRRDTLMAAILMAVMFGADIVAAATGLPSRARFALFVTPLSFGLVWLGYEASLRINARRACGATRPVEKSAAFLGSILSMTGGVMVVAHIALLGRFAWFDGLTTDQYMRTYLAALGVITMIMFDRAPKMMGVFPDGPLAKLSVHRAAAWLGVACGLGMVIAAITAPRPLMVLFALVLPMAPVALNRILIWKSRTPRGG